MEMLLPIASAYLLRQKGRHPARWLGGFAVIVAFASVELSGSRGGMIAVLIELGIFCFLFGNAQAVLDKRRAAVMSVMAIISLLAIFLWIAPPEVLVRYQSLLESPDLSLATRERMSIDALRAFRDYRWFGTGLGSFETIYPRYQSVLPNRVVDHAHNDFAELIAETGITGLVLALVSFQIFFSTAFRNLELRWNDLGECIRLGAAVGCCGVLVHSFSDFNLHIPANAAWFFACAGISGIPVLHVSKRTVRFPNS